MRFVVLVLALSACSGDTPPEVDANPGGPRCSKQLYDLCTAEHDCESNLCVNFGTYQVCSMACTSTCPADKDGTAGTCESGVCKPGAPNMCHL
jgi:hypothetical protein